MDIQEMAEEHGTRKVNLGPEQYLSFGNYWGPGIVDVPNNVADELERAVARVNRKIKDEDAHKRTDAKDVSGSPAAAATLTDEQLQAEVDARRARADLNKKAKSAPNTLTDEELKKQNDIVAAAALESAKAKAALAEAGK